MIDLFDLFNYKNYEKNKLNEDKNKLFHVILGLATGNPEYKVTQEQALKIAINVPECFPLKNFLNKIYKNSKINTRYMAIPDFTSDQNKKDSQNLFPENTYSIPIQLRLSKYKEVAIPLITNVCENAISQAINHYNIDKENIGKLILITSTGFFGPSLDCELIKNLELSRNIDRSLIHFMGCAAAINGFRLAMDYLVAHPNKIVLMASIEISSVHSTFKNNINDVIPHAIFSDGVAACVIGSKKENEVPFGTLAIIDEHSELINNTEDGITLGINDECITCILSKYLPKYISENIGNFIESFLAKHNIQINDCLGTDFFWAIHPGGKRIIEESQKSLSLNDSHVKDSWNVLENYGNMLSCSILFVLERILKRQNNYTINEEYEKHYKRGLAYSFSPGVGVESIMFKNIRPKG